MTDERQDAERGRRKIADDVVQEIADWPPTAKEVEGGATDEHGCYVAEAETIRRAVIIALDGADEERASAPDGGVERLRSEVEAVCDAYGDDGWARTEMVRRLRSALEDFGRLAARAEGGSEPVAWMVEWQTDGEWQQGAVTLSERQAQTHLPPDDIEDAPPMRVTPLYRRPAHRERRVVEAFTDLPGDIEADHCRCEPVFIDHGRHDPHCQAHDIANDLAARLDALNDPETGERPTDPSAVSSTPVGEPGEGEREATYPCIRCGRRRTKAEGGTTFTVCDDCWDDSPPTDADRPPEGESGAWTADDFCDECVIRGGYIIEPCEKHRADPPGDGEVGSDEGAVVVRAAEIINDAIRRHDQYSDDDGTFGDSAAEAVHALYAERVATLRARLKRTVRARKAFADASMTAGGTINRLRSKLTSVQDEADELSSRLNRLRSKLVRERRRLTEAETLIESMRGTFRRACDVAVNALRSGQSKEHAAAVLRETVEHDIGRINDWLAEADGEGGRGGVIPRKLHCPECGRYIGRQPWPVQRMRVVPSAHHAAPWSQVVPCRDCGWVECVPASWVIRAVRLVLRSTAA